MLRLTIVTSATLMFALISPVRAASSVEVAGPAWSASRILLLTVIMPPEKKTRE
jgi:hypothetical protein